MRAGKWAATALIVLAAAGATWWVFGGSPAGDDVVGNANVVGGVVGVAAFALTLLLLLRSRRGRAAVTVITSEQVQAATEYLAGETLRYWREQVKDRRIITPSPVSVRWQWAADDVAVPAPLASEGVVLTVGVVTQLREQLYDRLGKRRRVVLLGQAGAREGRKPPRRSESQPAGPNTMLTRFGYASSLSRPCSRRTVAHRPIAVRRSVMSMPHAFATSSGAVPLSSASTTRPGRRSYARRIRAVSSASWTTAR
ncbi:MAG TPA: hypothetical protein VFM37_12220 [Pseudonocardiaceae bacterium]|nr:hypothetical protein [Pseudonocardiaceae bacterium]